MKLNPSSLVITFLSLPNIFQIQAGSDFSTCIGKDYNTLVSFASNVPDKENFCCSSSQCTALSSSGCPLGINAADFQAQCNAVGQTKFCVAKGYFNSLPSILPGNLCGGTIGTTSSSNSTVGTCPSFDAIGNTLDNQSTIPNKFSWLCCDKNSCSVSSNVAINGNTANTNCPVGQYSLICFADNGAWTCTGDLGTNIGDISQPIGSCVEQVVSSISNTPSENPTTTSSQVGQSPNSGGSSNTNSGNSQNGGGNCINVTICQPVVKNSNDNNRPNGLVNVAILLSLLFQKL